MRTLRSWLLRLAGLFHQNPRDREIDEELESHLQLHIDDNMHAGMAPEEARRIAVLTLGGVQQTKESYRDRRSLPVLEAVVQDVCFGLRMLRKNPGFTVVAVLTLALGIGANTAFFSVMQDAFLNPVPWKDPDRILNIMETNAKTKVDAIVSPANFLDWKDQSLQGPFAYVAAWRFIYANLSGHGQPEQVAALTVTADYFRLLGYDAAFGRTFLRDEDRPGNEHVVVLSHDFWQRRFAADRSIVGQDLEIDSRPYRVIGVLPADFHMFRVLNRPLDLFVPFVLDPARLDRTGKTVFVYARLKPGVSLRQAQSEMDAAYAQLAQDYPATNSGTGARVRSLPQQWRQGGRPVMLFLVGAACSVLLIACLNVANLLLARGAARRPEMTVRVALGAGRLRRIRQLQMESMLLAACGCAAGLLFAYGSIRALNRFIPYTMIDRTDDFRLSAPLLLFTLAVSLLTSVLFGLAPALENSRAGPGASLTETARNAAGNLFSRRLRNFQVVAQIALSVVLLVAGVLMQKSALWLVGVNRGLDVHNVAAMQISLPQASYKDARAVGRFYREVVERVRSTPGIENASAVNFPPLAPQSTGARFAPSPHAPLELSGQATGEFAKVFVASPDYFRTVRIPVLAGRDFTEQDADENNGVAIVSESMARRMWPGQDAIGKRIWPDFPQEPTFWTVASKNLPLRVVGIVGDLHQDGTLDINMPQVYVPYMQNPSNTMSILIRTAARPVSYTQAVREAVWSLDKNQPVLPATTLEDVVAETFSTTATIARLTNAFAVLALLLASIGLYGVISYSVGQRTHEIGIRMALGAQPARILKLVMMEGMRLVALGIVAGSLVALASTRLLGELLFGVASNDPATFVEVAVLLAAVALLASYIPAWRAMRVDPAVALRHE